MPTTGVPLRRAVPVPGAKLTPLGKAPVSVIEGLGTSKCRLKYVLSSEPVSQGDLVVSSGLEGVFPKGLLIGEIALVTGETGAIFQNIIVEPMVAFDKLEEVFVVLP